MLIGRVSDGRESGHSGNGDDRNNNYHEYQTANELYEIMAESRRFDSDADETLTAGDLVILYKNLDIGTKLITEAKYSQTKPTNQYVETIVYNDDPDSDESDIGEICSAEDIRNVMMINKERIDLLSNTSSYDSNLCQKFGNVAVNHCNLAGSYNKNFLFKDPFIRDQLNSIIPNETTLLPTSLLDYICCKRLEDNYNFYMDSVITYVQHTIEHLKRISNGDYLTEKAKKKWKELDDPITKKDENTQSLVLANSISIPLRVDHKHERINSIFSDVVHSAVDIRSLSKILEKKIVLEIPKLINGTYKLFSKRFNDNLIISCKTDSVNNETQSRVDVVLKLKQSESGHVVSKLNSIMILQTSPQTSIQDFLKSGQLPSLCEKENIMASEEAPKIIELNGDDDVTKEVTYESSILTNKSQETYDDSLFGTDTDVSSVSPRCRINDFADTFMLYRPVQDEKTYSDEQTEANFHVMSPNELRNTVHRLNMNSPVPEESEVSIKRKKSAPKIRIKSPYENSSHAIEEKKRKRLLEIRERRENKKKALSENCKISKHKYSKGAVMAQASNSVTKLSISNKSFYNSIYGQAVNIEGKNVRTERRFQNRDLKIVVEMENCEEEQQEQTPKQERNKEKYINHSYYLDDADTEVMRIQMKQMSDTDNTTGGTASSSVASDDFGSNISLLKELMNSSTVSNQLMPTASNISQNYQQTNDLFKKIIIDMDRTPLETIQSVSNMVPSNSPKDNIINTSKLQKECRKSIDEIYNLMNQKGTTETISLHPGKKHEQKIKKMDSVEKCIQKDHESLQPSDSGTSLKHHLTSSIPSCFSFDKNNTEQQINRNVMKKTEMSVPSTTSKILTNGKSQSSRSHDEKLKKDRKNMSSPVNKISENPLKAISQLLHEFDNIKKNRYRNDSRSNKKPENDNKRDGNRQVTFKKPVHQEQQTKDSEPPSRISTPKGRKSRLTASVNSSKLPNGKPPMDEKTYPERTNKKKVTDLIDEVKEARGEAVRGPPKVQSRLDSLAQPKKSYIQAHTEQYPNRNLRHVTPCATNRQRHVNSTVAERREVLNVRQRKVTEIAGCPKANSAVPPLGSRRSSSSSPDGNQRGSPVPVTAPSHKPNVPETPEILMTKMDTVVSYVKNHYGRTAPIQDLKDFIGAQKSRVPLIPTDLDIGSVASSRTAEESTTLGKKLHYMIDTMINITPPALASLREKNEVSLNNKNNLNEAFLGNIEQFDDVLSNTDYPIDIFGDKSIATAVASLPKDNDVEDTICRNNIDLIAYDIQPFNSSTELERLENALYRRLSAGAFHKRLRIKNLTLTPKHSLQQVFVLHSGDAGSMVIKSTVSQLSKNNSKSKTTLELNKPLQSNSHVDWTFADFPAQVSTVGYAFPLSNTESAQKTSNDFKSDSSNSRADRNNKSESRKNKTIQCFKGSSIEPLQDQSVQVNSVVDSIKPVRFEILQNDENKSAFKIKIDDRFSQENTSKEMEKSPKTIDLSESQESKLNAVSNNQCVPNRTDIDNSTSLDVLVGLLNEIKNITTCQTYITKHEASHLGISENSKCTELQFILKNAELQEDSVDLSPENALSFDSLRHVEQQSFMGAIIPSIHSIQYEPLLHRSPLHQDKEVNVSISGIEYVHTFTEVPSRFLPIAVHHSTNVTSSLIGVISQPSEQSLYSFSDYQTLYCNSSFNRIIELPNVEPKKSYHTLKCTEIITEEIYDFKKGNSKLSCERPKRNNARVVRRSVSNFEALLKIKRDVLVTVYSILVMTVFAALSFPEILYKV